MQTPESSASSSLFHDWFSWFIVAVFQYGYRGFLYSAMVFGAIFYGGREIVHNQKADTTIDLVRHIQASGGVAIQLDRDERIVQVLGNRELLSGVQNVVLEGAPIESIVRLDSSATSGRRSYRELFNNCAHRLGKTTTTDVRVHVSSFAASGSSWMIVYRVENPTAKDES